MMSKTCLYNMFEIFNFWNSKPVYLYYVSSSRDTRFHAALVKHVFSFFFFISVILYTYIIFTGFTDITIPKCVYCNKIIVVIFYKIDCLYYSYTYFH